MKSCHRKIRDLSCCGRNWPLSQVSAGFAAASNLQLLRRDALLRNFGFQPQVLGTVRTAPFEGPHVLGPDPKELQNRVRTIRQADRMAGSSVTFVQKPKETKTSTKVTSSCRKNQSRTSVFDHLGSPAATIYCTENRDTRAALSCWRRQGSPPSTLPRSTQQD